VSDTQVRLDKWLWAARFYKTRSIAAEAVDSGKVKLNGERPKSAKQPRIGDQLEIRVGPYAYTVKVTGLSDKRGPASEAAKLYQETEESAKRRGELREELRANAAAGIFPTGRPTKRQRRQLEDLRRSWEE
jgi:ribosome-associated heat shock protein Hsp15